MLYKLFRKWEFKNVTSPNYRKQNCETKLVFLFGVYCLGSEHVHYSSGPMSVPPPASSTVVSTLIGATPGDR